MDTRPAAYAVIIEQGRVLLTHWPGGGNPERAGWTLPGGGMQPGERPEQTVVREVYEETGYRIRLESLLGADSRYGDGARLPSGAHRTFHVLRLVYRAHILTGELGITLPEESTDDAQWIPLDQLEALPTLSLVEAAQAMLAGSQGCGRGTVGGQS